MLTFGKTIGLLAFSAMLSIGLAEGILRYFDLIDPPAFEMNQAYGYLMHPNQSVSPRGHRFRINSAGFRGNDFSPHKRESVFRLAFLGDSITYGGGEVTDNDLFVNQIAHRLMADSGRIIEPLNMSVPGWGIENMVSYISEKGLYESNCLVWVISSADFRRPKTTLEENGFWRVKPFSRLFYGATVMLRRAYFGIARNIGQSRIAEAGLKSETLEKNLELVKKTLASLKARGIATYVVVVPDLDGYRRNDGDFQQYRLAAEQLRIPFLDLNPVFQRHGVESLFFDGVHLTSQGHQIVAEAFVSFLELYSPPVSLSKNPRVN
jgi:hypothetical protein